MTLESIKRKAHDCGRTHRWADVRRDFSSSWRDRFDTLRIVGIGRKYVRLMDARGNVSQYEPEAIAKVW